MAETYCSHRKRHAKMNEEVSKKMIKRQIIYFLVLNLMESGQLGSIIGSMYSKLTSQSESLSYEFQLFT